MNNLFRLFVAAGVSAAALLVLFVGLARHDADLLAPLNLLLFVIALAVYLFPTALAVYRDCTSAWWIAVVNIFLGWTIFGWFIAAGWAAGGKVKAGAPIPGPKSHPLPTH